MPFVTVEPHVRLYYRLEGNPGLPVLMLSHSLGADHGMWDPQMPALLQRYQVLRYDTRGHGASDAPAGECTLERLALDALGIADELRIDQFAFCGLSLGGMTGQWIAAQAPARITHLVLANTSAKFPDPSIMENRRKLVLDAGMSAVEESVMGRFFMPSTLAEARNPYVATTRRTLLATPATGYAGCCCAVRDLDNRGFLKEIAAPTLVIASDFDQSTPWPGHGDFLVAQIRGARSVLLPTAHLSNIEAPEAFAMALLSFLG